MSLIRATLWGNPEQPTGSRNSESGNIKWGILTLVSTQVQSCRTAKLSNLKPNTPSINLIGCLYSALWESASLVTTSCMYSVSDEKYPHKKVPASCPHQWYGNNVRCETSLHFNQLLQALQRSCLFFTLKGRQNTFNYLVTLLEQELHCSIFSAWQVRCGVCACVYL